MNKYVELSTANKATFIEIVDTIFFKASESLLEQTEQVDYCFEVILPR